MSKKSIEKLHGYLIKLQELDNHSLDTQSTTEICSKLKEESFLRVFTTKEQEQILAATKDLENKEKLTAAKKISKVLLNYYPL